LRDDINSIRNSAAGLRRLFQGLICGIFPLRNFSVRGISNSWVRSSTRISFRDFRRNARDESLHRDSAFTLALPDASRKFDAAQFEKDNFVGVFDRDFHEILIPRFKKREIFGSIEFQPADARAHQLRAANFKFERRA